MIIIIFIIDVIGYFISLDIIYLLLMLSITIVKMNGIWFAFNILMIYSNQIMIKWWINTIIVMNAKFFTQLSNGIDFVTI